MQSHSDRDYQKTFLECRENLDGFAGVWYHQQMTVAKRKYKISILHHSVYSINVSRKVFQH